MVAFEPDKMYISLLTGIVMYKAFREGFSLKNILEKIKNHKAVTSALALVVLTAVIFWTTNSPAVVGVSASNRQLPIYCVQRDDKTVALSFDAAWGKIGRAHV